MGWRDSIGSEDRDNPRDTVVDILAWLFVLCVVLAVGRAILGI